MAETMKQSSIGTPAAVIRKAATSNAYEHNNRRHRSDARMRDTPVLVDYPCPGRRAADAESAADSLSRPNAPPRAARRGARPRPFRSGVGRYRRVQRDRHGVRAKGDAGREPGVELPFPQAVERNGAWRLWTECRRDTHLGRWGERRCSAQRVLPNRSFSSRLPYRRELLHGNSRAIRALRT